MKKRILAHMSSQTGDTLHVAGAMILDPEIHVIVIHAGEPQTNKGLLNFYRQVTDPGYPGTDVEPDSAYTSQRVKAVYASDDRLARPLYKALSVERKSDGDIPDQVDKILAAGKVTCETTITRTAPSHSMKQIKNFGELKVFRPSQLKSSADNSSGFCLSQMAHTHIWALLATQPRLSQERSKQPRVQKTT
jgi:hypothetical protein